jgi:hypothetical protein
MSKKPDALKKKIKEHSDELAKLGMGLAKNQFSYKVEEKTAKEYWQKRKNDFKKYNEKGSEYYNKIYTLMNLINKEESQMFLLRIAKFRNLGLELIKIIEKIEKNPSVINSKDKQQSQWSKKIRAEITDQSNSCLNYEKDMNASFREFYEKHIKEILE